MDRRRPSRALRLAHRLAAFALMVLWAGAPVMAVAHAAAEGHRFCAEHGTVEEASEVIVAAGSAGPADIVAARSQDAAHEDCAFATACRFGQTLSAEGGGLVGLLEPRPATFAAEIAAAVLFDVLVNAPKTSPPRRALCG